VVNSPPQPHLTPGKDPVPTCIGGWVGPRASLDSGKSRPTGIRSPDRPALSQSLYLLSYPADKRHTVSLLNVAGYSTAAKIWSYEGAFEGMRHLKRKVTVNAFVSICRAPTKWIQRTECHKWAHGHCVGFSDLFVCLNCNSVDRSGYFESEY
jgi:hypothetical protein